MNLLGVNELLNALLSHSEPLLPTIRIAGNPFKKSITA
jgi:hypothetical protein